MKNIADFRLPIADLEFLDLGLRIAAFALLLKPHIPGVALSWQPVVGRTASGK